MVASFTADPVSSAMSPPQLLRPRSGFEVVPKAGSFSSISVLTFTSLCCFCGRAGESEISIVPAEARSIAANEVCLRMLAACGLYVDADAVLALGLEQTKDGKAKGDALRARTVLTC